VTLDAIALARSMPGWEAGDVGTIRAILAESMERLARAGADFFVCPDNTAHLALEAPGPDLAVPGLHIAEVVAERAAGIGATRVGVLGTKYTMDGPIYPRELASRRIEWDVPDADDRRMIDDVIFDELVNGEFLERSRRAFVRVIDQLRARGCDAVALVCTEIPILVPPEVSPLPTLDSTVLLAHAGFDVAVGRRAMPTWRGGPLAGELR
jgi:aspartate racemase